MPSRSFPAITLLSDSTNGPEIPKCVNSISPSSSKSSFLPAFALSFTFLSDSPCKERHQSSFVTIGISDGRISVTVCPSPFASA